MTTIPDNCIMLEEAARRLQVPPHLLLFWQRRCGGFRILIGRSGAHAIRRGDMSLLVAISRLVTQERLSVGDIGAQIEQRGASSIIVAADRQHARALAQEAQDLSASDDFELEGQLVGQRFIDELPVVQAKPVAAPVHAPVAAPMAAVPPPLNTQPAITPEQAKALRMLAAAAGSIDSLNEELHALDNVLVSQNERIV